MNNFYARLHQLEKEGTPVAVVTITKSDGHTPRKVGSKMLVFPQRDNQLGFEGTIGGGNLEKLIIEEARRLLADGTALRFFARIDVFHKSLHFIN
ncbi:MAG: XdhC family protein, partial [Pseudomonadota bacterium]